MSLTQLNFASGLPPKIAPDYTEAERFVLDDGSKMGVLPDYFLLVLPPQNPEQPFEVFHKCQNFKRPELGYEMFSRLLVGRLGDAFVFIKGKRVIVGTKDIWLGFFDFPPVKSLTIDILPGTFCSEEDKYLELEMPENTIRTNWKIITLRGVRVFISEAGVVMQPADRDAI